MSRRGVLATSGRTSLDASPVGASDARGGASSFAADASDASFAGEASSDEWPVASPTSAGHASAGGGEASVSLSSRFCCRGLVSSRPPRARRRAILGARPPPARANYTQTERRFALARASFDEAPAVFGGDAPIPTGEGAGHFSRDEWRLYRESQQCVAAPRARLGLISARPCANATPGPPVKTCASCLARATSTAGPPV